MNSKLYNLMLLDIKIYRQGNILLILKYKCTNFLNQISFIDHPQRDNIIDLQEVSWSYIPIPIPICWCCGIVNTSVQEYSASDISIREDIYFKNGMIDLLYQ